MTKPQQRLLGCDDKEAALTLDDLIDYPQEVDLVPVGDFKYKLVLKSNLLHLKKDE